MHRYFNKSLLLVLFTTLNCHFIFSQKITLSGYITDASTGERLINANILDSNSKKGTTSNDYGFYSLSTTTNSTTISISYLGYVTLKKNISLKKNTTLNIQLVPESYSLGEVEISASKEVPIEKRNEISTISIPTKQIKKLPALGGEVDVLKVLQLMPGVQSGNEGASGLYVRGGSPDQNLTLLDGVPLYYVNHLGGFISTFNIDAINNIKLTKGGFPAQYGGRLSSVLDIRMKDGNMNKFQGSGMIGLLATKLSVEGPIKKDTTSYMISARRMLYDLFTRPISKLTSDGFGFGYTFYDFNAKINHKFSDKDRIYISTYLGHDRAIGSYNDKVSKFKSSLQWGNNLAAFRWNHLFNQKLFSNTTVSYTHYKFSTKNLDIEKDDNKETESFSSFFSGIYDLGIEANFDYFVTSNYTLKFGTNNIYHSFKPGTSRSKEKENGNNVMDFKSRNDDAFAWENAVYIENDLKIGQRIITNFGLRGVNYNIGDVNYFSVEPRLLATILIAKNTSLKTAYSKMQQNVHLLTGTGVGVPNDLWMPSTKTVAPQKSEQWSIGIAKSIKNDIYEFSLEGYTKKMTNMIAYKEGISSINTSTNWQNLIEKNGNGNSYGVELLLQKKQGRTTGWIGYTWSKTDRQFENINNGVSFPYKYDRRHDASVVFSHKLNEKIDISATWVYGTGAAYTLPIAKYQILAENDNSTTYPPYNPTNDTEEIYIYGKRNAERMRAFHKLDVGINFKKEKKWGERTWNVSIYNIYNRQNPYYYFVENEYGFSNNTSTIINTKIKQQSLFPIIPSVSYNFKF